MKQFLFRISFFFMLRFPILSGGLGGEALAQSVSVDTTYIQTLVDSCRNLSSQEAITLGQNTLALIEMSFLVTDVKSQSRLKFQKATLLRTIGNSYKALSDFPNALQFYQQCFKIAKEINDETNLGGALLNTGIVYHELHEYEKALDYMEQSEKLFKEIGNKRGLAYCFQSFGGVYSDLSQDSLALSFYEESLNMFTEINDKDDAAWQLNNIAQIYKHRKNYPEALDNYQFSLIMFEEVGDSSGVAFSSAGIGDIYENSEKNLKMAEKYYLRSLANAELGLKKQVLNALKDLYHRQGKYKEAFEMYAQYNLIKDSISTQQNAEEIRRREMQSDFEEKQAVAKAEHEKQIAIEEERQNKLRVIIISVIVGLLLVTVFSVFILNRWRVTQKQKKVIEMQKVEVEKQKDLVSEQKKIVEEKNKDITASITYAKRIQRAMLPHRRDIWAAFPQSFVLFKPKDIVSGDFYYFHKSTAPSNSPEGGELARGIPPSGGGGALFLAAADCTGHGVPGAFMSMIGSEKLDDALAHSADTSEILAHLNKGIKTSLKQSDSDESTRDGMDIALVKLEVRSEKSEVNTIHYAGANRPLWIIRKTPLPNSPSLMERGQGGEAGVGLEEIKATKKAIGGFTDDSQHFDTHEIKLQHGDTFYIFSDGYADQDGGEKGKKLMTKNFKQMLLNIQDKSMKEQERYLDDFIENWKAGKEQVDDILVIGVRM